jgi:hypothetical protein
VDEPVLGTRAGTGDMLGRSVGTCIILDTNQWDRMPMLRHQMAAALLFGLHDHADVFIGLPTVIRGEVELHLSEKLQVAQRDLARASGELRQIFGHAREVERHADEEVKQAFQTRLDELESLVKILPATEEDLAEAGRMVLAYMAPSSRTSQQYRDSVIWRIAVREAQENDVHIVTNDKGFYRDSSSDELADPLADEIHKLSRSVRLFRNVEALLKHWEGGEPSLQTAGLRDLVATAVANEVSGVLQDQGGFVVQGQVKADIEVFLTEVHDQVAVSGKFEYYLAEPELLDAADPPAVADVRATATVGLDGPEVRAVSLDSVTVTAITPHDTPTIATIVFGRGAIALGSRTEPYRLRAKLDLP